MLFFVALVLWATETMLNNPPPLWLVAAMIMAGILIVYALVRCVRYELNTD